MRKAGFQYSLYKKVGENGQDLRFRVNYKSYRKSDKKLKIPSVYFKTDRIHLCSYAYMTTFVPFAAFVWKAESNSS